MNSNNHIKQKPELYTSYPLSGVLLYNGTTIIHYILGGIGILIGYGYWIGYWLGGAYLAFSFIEMYLIMPLKVCPNCVYYGLDNSVCISGLNLISKKVSRQGNIKDFSRRASGPFCPNYLYLAALALPVIAIIPALIINFNLLVLIILLAVIGLLIFRFFILFTRIACLHCRAKNICPNARSMGLNDRSV
jgi:hypothetical protein